MRGRVIRWLLPLVVIAALGVGAAMATSTSMRSSGGTVKARKGGKYGLVLVSSSGRALYRFTSDRKRVSTCSGACAKLWPPLSMKRTTKPTAGTGASAGLLGTIRRPGGIVQVTYAGFPLYLYAGDRKPGEMNGEGFQGKWFLLNATGALVKHAAAAQATTTTSGGGGGTWG